MPSPVPMSCQEEIRIRRHFLAAPGGRRSRGGRPGRRIGRSSARASPSPRTCWISVLPDAVDDGVEKDASEGRVLEEPAVVLQPDERAPCAVPVPVGEGHLEAADQGVDGQREEDQQRRQVEQVDRHAAPAAGCATGAARGRRGQSGRCGERGHAVSFLVPGCTQRRGGHVAACSGGRRAVRKGQDLACAVSESKSVATLAIASDTDICFVRTPSVVETIVSQAPFGMYTRSK